MNSNPWRLCVAPMLDLTDRHCRYFLRLLSRHTRLYTEMITTGAVLHGNQDHLLRFHAAEHPVALQLGSSHPGELKLAAQAGEAFGYDEINLNVGCPSDRVQSGRFGACLMAEPGLVADCVAAMKSAVRVPVTVKTRIGIDDQDSYEQLARFVEQVTLAGCDALLVHARKAWLHGVSPKENREIPPLRYDVVYRLKRDFPQLPVVINGGIKSLGEAEAHLQKVDGVMIGREAYHNPYLLAQADSRLFGDTRPAPTREEVVLALLAYSEQEIAGGASLKHITRHILGLYHGRRGARLWRRVLSERAHHTADAGLLRHAAGLEDAA